VLQKKACGCCGGLAFLVVGFLDGEYTGFLAKCTGFLASGLLPDT